MLGTSAKVAETKLYQGRIRQGKYVATHTGNIPGGGNGT